MRIKSELLWGESIRDKSKVYDLLQTKKLPLGYYLLLYTKEGRLELIPSVMQSNRYHISRDCVVFGIAHGKKEAQGMICKILTEIYANHTYDSVSDYVREVLGEPVC